MSQVKPINEFMKYLTTILQLILSFFSSVLLLNAQEVMPPGNLSATCVADNDAVEISWTGQPQDIGYRIIVNNLYDNELHECVIPNNNNYTYIYDDIDEDETYAFSVRAIQNNGNSNIESEPTATIGSCSSGGYATVVNLDRIAGNGGNTQIYELGPITFCNTDPSLPVTIRAREVNRTAFPVVFTVLPNECKTLGQEGSIYKLKSLTTGFELHPSRIRTEAQQKTDNINAIIPAFRLSPNPVQQELLLQYSVFDTQQVSITIYNIQGQKVTDIVSNETHSKGDFQRSVDTNDLPDGLYQVVYKSDSQTFHSQFVKNTQ